MSLLGHPDQFALQAPVLGRMVHALLWNWFPELLPPLVQRMCTDAQTLGYLSYRVPTHPDLMHRVPLELVAVTACPRLGLLASKSGGQAPTNLGAPH